jgi:hypothetical protein
MDFLILTAELEIQSEKWKNFVHQQIYDQKNKVTVKNVLWEIDKKLTFQKIDADRQPTTSKHLENHFLEKANIPDLE